MDYITIAISKGRLGNEACKRLKEMGIGDCIELESRKLIFKDDINKIIYIHVKPSDVVTYVEKGVADLGIVGKDTILENEGDIYEIEDLGFGKCKFSIAGLKGDVTYGKDEIVKVATKYPKIAKKYFKEREQRIEIIKLNGSVELAPLVGLSDIIVDIVETGSTLRANGLDIIEDMFGINAKLISNRVSYKFKFQKIKKIANMFKELEQIYN